MTVTFSFLVYELLLSVMAIDRCECTGDQVGGDTLGERSRRDSCDSRGDSLGDCCVGANSSLPRVEIFFKDADGDNLGDILAFGLDGSLIVALLAFN